MKSTGKCASGQRAFPAHLLADAENWLQYIPYEGQHKGAMKETEERVFQYMPPWEATFLADSRATDKQFQYMPPTGGNAHHRPEAPRSPVSIHAPFILLLSRLGFNTCPPRGGATSASSQSPTWTSWFQYMPPTRGGNRRLEDQPPPPPRFNTCPPRGGATCLTICISFSAIRFNTCPPRGGATL